MRVHRKRVEARDPDDKVPWMDTHGWRQSGRCICTHPPHFVVLPAADAGTPQDPSRDSFGSGWKAIFIRSLNILLRRTATAKPNLAALIRAYVAVQYNALVDLAAAPGSANYSSSWIGPPATQLLPWGQVAALDVLNAAFSIAPADASGCVSLVAAPCRC